MIFIFNNKEKGEMIMEKTFKQTAEELLKKLEWLQKSKDMAAAEEYQKEAKRDVR